MKTEELIDNLSTDVAPVSRGAVAARLALGVGMGAFVSAILMWTWLGVRPDLSAAMGTGMYWMKFFYTLIIALIGFWIVERLARPGVRANAQVWLEIVPLGAIAAIAIYKLAMAAPDARMHLMMGSSANVCPWRIIVLSLPILVGALWGMRGLAPTHLVRAGLAAGVLAGAAGAFVYAFHCNESAAPFVAIFYTLGIAAAGVIGAVLGRFALRW